jgi:hypothetical protein
MLGSGACQQCNEIFAFKENCIYDKDHWTLTKNYGYNLTHSLMLRSFISDIPLARNISSFNKIGVALVRK